MTLQQVQSIAPTEKLPVPATADVAFAANTHTDSDPPVEVAAPSAPPVQAPAAAGPQPEGVERRENPRVAVSVGVGFRSDSNFYTGFTEDISEGGLFVATHMLKPIGSEIHITCALPTGPEISVRGIVRWLRDPHDYVTGAHPGMGVQFIDISPADLARIREFVAVREPLFFEA